MLHYNTTRSFLQEAHKGPDPTETKGNEQKPESAQVCKSLEHTLVCQKGVGEQIESDGGRNPGS